MDLAATVTRALFLWMALGVTALAPCQSTWTAGAAGADFAEIAAAVADPRVTHGDTLLVREGDYAAFSTDKGLRIVAERRAYFRGIEIHDVPAGRRFIGCRFDSTCSVAQSSSSASAGPKAATPRKPQPALA